MNIGFNTFMVHASVCWFTLPDSVRVAEIRKFLFLPLCFLQLTIRGQHSTIKSHPDMRPRIEIENTSKVNPSITLTIWVELIEFCINKNC